MSSKRLYFTLIGIIGLLFVGLVAGAYETNNLLTTRATKLTALKAKSQALTQEQASLTKAKKDLASYKELQEIAQSVVPEDKNQAEAVREIVNIAAANNVSLSAINFPASTLGTTAITGTNSSSTAPTPAASAATSNPNSKANGLSQLQLVKNIPGVYQLTITIVGDPNKPVPYNKFISFLSALEHNRRTAQVSTINIQPVASTDPDDLTFTLSLNEYIKP
jgi:hypothetical protein